MTPTTLRFRARGNSLVPNHEREEAGVRSFVGRKFAATKVDNVDRHGWESTEAIDEVAYNAEYVDACAQGALWPADEETARVCSEHAVKLGLEPFKLDPTFGGVVALKKLPTAADNSTNKPATSAEKG